MRISRGEINVAIDEEKVQNDESTTSGGCAADSNLKMGTFRFEHKRNILHAMPHCSVDAHQCASTTVDEMEVSRVAVAYGRCCCPTLN